jgi:hypothetical protein
VDGTLYVFPSRDPARNSERTFVTGSVTGEWVPIPNAGALTDVQLEAAGDPTIVYNADLVVAGGGDTALSPDNMDASGQYLMINEDGTTESRAVMAAKGRDGSIWRFDLVKGPTGVDGSTATARRGAQPARARRRPGRAGRLGDERDHRRVGPVRRRHVALRRPGASAHHAARRPDGHRGGRAALRDDTRRLVELPRDVVSG